MKLVSVRDSENIAKVVSTGEGYFTVSYLSSSKKRFKSARVYSFETTVEYLDSHKVLKEYSSMEEAGFKQILENMFVEVEEVVEESSSEIESEEEYDYSDSDDSFIVPDDETVLQKPVDHRVVDEQWNSWRPTTPGAKRFKDKIDQIESYMNHQIDEKFVFKK